MLRFTGVEFRGGETDDLLLSLNIFINMYLSVDFAEKTERLYCTVKQKP